MSQEHEGKPSSGSRLWGIGLAVSGVALIGALVFVFRGSEFAEELLGVSTVTYLAALVGWLRTLRRRERERERDRDRGS